MKGRKTILFVVEIAVFSALALAFDFFCGLYGFAWLNGGSISIAMLPIFIMCYRHGLKGGLLCGLLVGSIQLLWADGFVHPVQAIIDYPAAYLVTGFAGIFFNQVKNSEGGIKNDYICLGILLGGALRLLLASISGTVYFGVDFIGSVLYNVTYLFPSTILCMILACVVISTMKQYVYKDLK